jgi:TPP-dependent indolepyruvate ferredoxin oxidoreductase alpha subunit
VEWVRVIDRTYDVGRMRDTLREALTTEKGPKVIVASSECMLNRQRREKPIVNQAIKEGRGSRSRASASTRRSAPATTPACGFRAARRWG